MRLHELNLSDIYIDKRGRDAFMVVEMGNRWQEAPSHINGRTFGVRDERGRLLLMLKADIFMALDMPAAMTSFRQQLEAIMASNPGNHSTVFSLASVTTIPRISLPLGISVATVHPSILHRKYADHVACVEAARAARVTQRAATADAKNSRLARFSAAMVPLNVSLPSAAGDVRLEQDATRITFTLEAFERFSRQLQH